MNDEETTLREALAERAGAAPGAYGSGSAVLERARRVQQRRRVGAAVAGVGVCAALAVSVLPRLSAPVVPAGPTRVLTSTVDVVQERDRARRWAAGLSMGDAASFRNRPRTLRVDGRVRITVDGSEVDGLAGVPELADLHRTANGWLALGAGPLPDGSYSLLHYRSGEASARVLAHPPSRTPLLLDPTRRRVAMLWPGSDAVSIFDTETGGSRSVPLPHGASRPALATWTGESITLVEGAADTSDDPRQPLPAATASSEGADTTRVWRLDVSTGVWSPGTTLASRVVAVQQPDDVGGSSASAVVLDRQGDRACVSLLTPEPALLPMRCWTGPLAGTPTAVVSPEGRHALVGVRGEVAGDVELFDLGSAREETGVAKEALMGELDSYVWESEDSLAAVAGPDRAAGVPFRLDVTTGTAQRLPADPLDAYDREFAEVRTGVNLSRG